MSFSKVLNNKLPEKIEVPTSKSYSNRALILAAMDARECTINNITWAQDVMDMIKVLKKIGLQISTGSDSVTIYNSFPSCEATTPLEIELDLGEGGTTSRFLVGLLSLGSHTYILNAKNRMNERPMDGLYESLRELGVDVQKLTDNSFPIKIKGPLSENKSIEIDCSETTQFYSSLLLLTYKNKLTILPRNLLASKGYVEITKALLENFTPNYIVPADYSGASYAIAFAALNQEITITNCTFQDILQGDSVILDILGKDGLKFYFQHNGLLILKMEKLNSFIHDCSDCPDLVPTLCYLASYAKGETILKNIANLRHKESDRIKYMIKTMKAFGVPCKYDDYKDELTISGIERDDDIREIETSYDHRMVMAATLFLKHNGGGSISPSETVNKSYPGFFDIF